MKKIFSTLLILLYSSLYITTAFATIEDPIINSPSVILIESSSGRIFYEKNAHEQKYPASITKIMTALIALERGNLDTIVTASQNAVYSIERGSSNIGILTGEEISLRELLLGLLVSSANEAANIIAEHIAGSVGEFALLMNQKAIELGAKNTNFVNPNGLHSDNQYTTAYDMALISKYAMTIPEFRDMTNTDYYIMQPTNKYKEVRYLSNSNHLINRHRSSAYRSYLYSPAIGIKTGYTSKSNHTIVAAAEKKGMELIAVVLDSKQENGNNYSYIDAIELFEFAFNNYSMKTIVKPGNIIEEVNVSNAKNNKILRLVAKEPMKALLPNGYKAEDINKALKLKPDIIAPIQKGDILGIAEYTYKGDVVGNVELMSNQNISRDSMYPIKSSFHKFFAPLWVKILAGLFGIIIFFMLSIQYTRISRKRRRNKFVRYRRRLR